MTTKCGKKLFIRFSASAFRELPSVCVFRYFPFGFEGRIWDLIVSVPDHCLSFYSTVHARLLNTLYMLAYISIPKLNSNVFLHFNLIRLCLLKGSLQSGNITNIYVNMPCSFCTKQISRYKTKHEESINKPFPLWCCWTWSV